MSRFGWPRPPAEGVAAELAALQESQGKLPTGSADGLPPGVAAGTAFPVAARKGYEPSEVDAFLEGASTATAAEIRAVRFSTARKRGYDMDAVDDALDRLASDADVAGR